MTTNVSRALTIAAAALLAGGISVSAAAHGPQGQGGMMGQGQAAQQMPGGMMGQGGDRDSDDGGQYYGPMMGQGGMMYGPMGGYGAMGPGMMYGQPWGNGAMGPGMMWGYGNRVVPMHDLDVGDVKHFLEHRIEWQGYHRLKVGKVAVKDDDVITAEIVTTDGALVQKLEIDRHTGEMHEVN